MNTCKKCGVEFDRPSNWHHFVMSAKYLNDEFDESRTFSFCSDLCIAKHFLDEMQDPSVVIDAEGLHFKLKEET